MEKNHSGAEAWDVQAKGGKTDAETQGSSTWFILGSQPQAVGGSVCPHGGQQPVVVFTDVHVDAGFRGGGTGHVAPRHDTLQLPITHQRATGVTLRNPQGKCQKMRTGHVGSQEMPPDPTDQLPAPPHRTPSLTLPETPPRPTDQPPALPHHFHPHLAGVCAPTLQACTEHVPVDVPGEAGLALLIGDDVDHGAVEDDGDVFWKRRIGHG